MYDLINQIEADKIKEILLESTLNEKINIEILNRDMKLIITDITETSESQHFNSMKEFYVLNNNNYKPLLTKGKYYEIFINIGEWSYETRLKETHITIGSNKFHDYSFQLELSQAIKDDKNLYIVKNISNFAGKGALVRLYRGLGKDNKSIKEIRKEIFIKEFDSEILSFENKDWIVIAKLSLNDLFNETLNSKNFNKLLEPILRATLLVESISSS